MKQVRFDNRRAMTMIELLVTIGVAVVVLGLALRIFVESDRTTRRLTRLQTAAQYCDQTLSAATAMIEGAVAADNVEKTSDTQALAKGQTFSAGELQMFDYGNGVLYRVNLAPRPDGIMIQRDPISSVGSAGSGAVTLKEKASAIEPAGFKPTIRFAYAGVTPPGQRPRYQDSWTSPGWPALIQVRVEAKVEGQPQPIILETAAIPGLVPARSAKEARP